MADRLVARLPGRALVPGRRRRSDRSAGREDLRSDPTAPAPAVIQLRPRPPTAAARRPQDRSAGGGNPATTRGDPMLTPLLTHEVGSLAKPPWRVKAAAG